MEPPVGVAGYGSTNCHVNAIAYCAPDDAYLVSDYIASSYIKVFAAVAS